MMKSDLAEGSIWMNLIEVLKAFVLGIVEGVTEWLPISSTGHMILVDEFLQLHMSDAFKEMFFVVIQLGAILAVVMLYWNKLFPFAVQKGKGITVKKDTLALWPKIIVSCIPAAVVGLLWDDELNALFYNFQTVAVTLILFGVLFLWVEGNRKNKPAKVTALNDITYQTALFIGVFQLIAAVFPGTSRSGATIVGALLLGVARTTAAEYTFLLAVPVMFGASALKLLKFGFDFSALELLVLAVGMVTAFAVSVLSIRFLMKYIKNHDFKVFGWYRIVLGCAVLAYFFFAV